MTDLFDFDKPPDLYAVMGNPIAHSKSPQIHTAYARQTRQRMAYRAILVDVGGFAQAVGNFHANGGKGLNVTVPFKQDAWRLADELSERARLAGAVNTLVLRDDNSIYGDNTDGVGLVRDLSENNHCALANQSILLLGAGGAARGVLKPLLDCHPQSLMIANRSADKAIALAAEFREMGAVSGGGFDMLPGKSFDLIINATAASLAGELPPLPEDVLRPGGVCYDMMYGAGPTPFMSWGRQHGAGRVLDGLGMLVEQAAESFALWRGARPDTATVIVMLREQMSRSC